MAKATNRRIPKSPPTNTSFIPPPFEAAPSSLSPLLPILSKSSVYITHIDRHPASFKRRIFSVPVLLNIFILVLLLWRAYAIIPYYLSILIPSGAAHQNEDSADTKPLISGKLAWLVTRRAATFLIDYLLVTIVGKWPFSFFLEQPHNPVSWRWKTGFREQEVVVRISRNWSGDDLVTGIKRGGESPFFKTRVLPALDVNLMEKTGYAMMNDSWDLDFGTMVGATILLDKGELKTEDLDRKVLVWMSGGAQHEQWIVWDEKNFGKEVKYEDTKEEEVEEIEEIGHAEGRAKILQIQKRLNEMGKDELFYRWVELIQYESTRPGGFTRERQLEAGAKVQSLFQEHGVNFEEFERSVGGI